MGKLLSETTKTKIGKSVKKSWEEKRKKEDAEARLAKKEKESKMYTLGKLRSLRDTFKEERILNALTGNFRDGLNLCVDAFLSWLWVQENKKRLLAQAKEAIARQKLKMKGKGKEASRETGKAESSVRKR